MVLRGRGAARELRDDGIAGAGARGGAAEVQAWPERAILEAGADASASGDVVFRLLAKNAIGMSVVT